MIDEPTCPICDEYHWSGEICESCEQDIADAKQVLKYEVVDDYGTYIFVCPYCQPPTIIRESSSMEWLCTDDSADIFICNTCNNLSRQETE